MKTSKLLMSAGLASIVVVASISNAAFAWHPQGTIVKKVQNVTTGSAVSDANTVSTAIATKPGDIIKYTITVSNVGAAAEQHYNDMANTVLKDTFPAGTELVSNPAQHQVNENLGTIEPGKSVTKEYALKVTAKSAGTITNEACFTGNSTVNDNPQQGCDKALITVTIPEPPVVPPVTPPVTPTTPTTPVTPTTPTTPVELPHTGIAGNIVVSTIILGAVAYAASFYARSRKLVRNS